MKSLARFMQAALILVAATVGHLAFADARVMNPGETIGKLVFLSPDEVKDDNPKYMSLSAMTIPVFGELPFSLGVIGGAITLKQQNLISHVQLKCVAGGRPNLDISGLDGGLENPLLSSFKDGDWVHMKLDKDGTILIEPSTEKAGVDFYEAKMKEIKEFVPDADLTVKRLIPHAELGWNTKDLVGSKASNYAELIKALNDEREVVRPGFGIPFAYYDAFINRDAPGNKKLKKLIDSLLKDRLMRKVADVGYRDKKLKVIRDLILSSETEIDPDFIDELIAKFDTFHHPVTGLPRKMKLRSSTNAEDLPNFNGAGLYDSKAYEPTKNGIEKPLFKKKEEVQKALRFVWSSVWNLRAFDERTAYKINHAAVKMAMEVNPSFVDEGADGVVVTKNVLKDPRYPGAGVYIETQRGDYHGVANPLPGVKPMKVLVQVDRSQPLNKDAYKINIIQTSNVADNEFEVLDHDNPNPVINDEEIKELTYQVLKAELHFKPLLGADNDNFALDLEFKVSSEDTGKRQVYLKQARPYID